MNRPNIFMISALALMTVMAGAIVATAQDTPDPNDAPAAEVQTTRAAFRGDRGGRNSRSHRGGRLGGEMFRTIFDAADADGDGTVTREEIDAYRTARLSEIDASGDSALSIEEFDALYRDITRSRMVDTFQALDAD
ncbi:MAG: hypothetical protein AAF264_05985, partial [Pseudomonadota bacterium]